jgi:hypothetical protein
MYLDDKLEIDNADWKESTVYLFSTPYILKYKMFSSNLSTKKYIYDNNKVKHLIFCNTFFRGLYLFLLGDGGNRIIFETDLGPCIIPPRPATAYICQQPDRLVS